MTKNIFYFTHYSNYLTHKNQKHFEKQNISAQKYQKEHSAYNLNHSDDEETDDQVVSKFYNLYLNLLLNLNDCF